MISNLNFKRVNFYIFRDFVLCGFSPIIQVKKSCRMYQVSQTSLPPYFNYSRWVCSFVLAFTLSIIVLAVFTHPKLFNNSLDKNRKFWISIFGVSGFMVFTGLAGISAGAWFSYACYANKRRVDLRLTAC